MNRKKPNDIANSNQLPLKRRIAKMLFALRCYMELNRVVGIGNTPYDHNKGRFVDNHMPSIVYSMILNTAFLIYMPYAEALITETFYHCERYGMVSIASHAIGVAKTLATMMTISGAWYNRQRIMRLGNAYVRILQRQYAEIWLSSENRQEIAHCKRLCAYKLTAALARFVVLVIQFYGGADNLVICAQMQADYVLDTLFVIVMEVITTCVDCTIFLVQAINNMLIGVMLQQLESMCDDVRLLLTIGRPCRRDRCCGSGDGDVGWRRPCHYALWYWQLQCAVNKLTRRRQKLYALHTELLSIFQWQLLITLFCSFLVTILVIFRLLLYFENLDTFNFMDFFAYVVIHMLFYWDVTLRFQIFESLRKRWRMLFWHVNELWFQLLSLPGGGRGRLLLERRLEFFSLEVGRQIQPNQKRTRRLQIVGFFDLNFETYFAMSSAIVVNVLVLCQIAIKLYL